MVHTLTMLTNCVLCFSATVYPFEVYLEAVKSISITHARCSSSRDRDFLATLVKDNFRSVTTFENFAKLCAFAMLGFNLKTCIEFQTDNDEEVRLPESLIVFVALCELRVLCCLA
jgi:hypothetical protein